MLTAEQQAAYDEFTCAEIQPKKDNDLLPALRNLPIDQQDEIHALRLATSTTRRLTISALEEVMYQPFAVLDHGFVRCIDYMGGDQAVTQGARVSYGAGTKAVSDDRGLIRYLISHYHSSPFELCEIKYHVKLPIFVARQWIRHRMANVNEYSARYSILDREFYIPRAQDLAQQSTSNNQGRGEHLSDERAEHVLALLRNDAMQTYDHYEDMIGPDTNLARELARINLPTGFYTQWYWKTDLHNLMNFLRLRNDSHAQMEIRAYAEVMQKLLALWVPLTAEAFRDYRQNSYTLSSMALEVVRRLVAGEEVNPTMTDLNKREWRELMEVLGRTY